MDDEVTQLARPLLDSEVTGISERKQRVILHIAMLSHIARIVNSVLAEQQTFGERLADRVVQFGGSWTFITILTGMLIAWIVLNSVALARVGGGFDPYPYIFLNLILSMGCPATSTCDPDVSEPASRQGSVGCKPGLRGQLEGGR
jgi:uncharacterized membrane protein